MIQLLRHPIRLMTRAFAFARLLIAAHRDARRLLNEGPCSLRQRNLWLSKWSRKSLESMGIRLKITGTPPLEGLLVANHLSYLDVMVLSSALPVTFLSKDEVRHWPIMGKFVDFAGTLYIKRENKRALVGLQQHFKDIWDQGATLAMFPEGTTTNGDCILPFHPSLFQPACEQDKPITPVHISYRCEGGNLSEDVHFWRDMSFVPHLLRLLSVRTITASVSFGRTRHPDNLDRKLLASSLREDVLELSSSTPSCQDG
jgi:1-acyl-sn-glycerol-3-phosphate acyltransferase